LLVAIISTEKELNKNFDDEGNKKVKKL